MMEDRAQAPILRAWYAPAGRFINEGFLNMQNQYFIPQNGQLTPIDGVQVDFGTGVIAVDDNTPVYQNDKVEYLVPNEFGSVVVRKGVVRYDSFSMRFVVFDLEEAGERAPSMEVVMLKITKVIGHAHA